MVPAALESAGFRVEPHARHFVHDAGDPEILRGVGQHTDWIFLTHDARQRYKPDELDAIMRSGIAHIVHVGHLPHNELAKSFVLAAPRILHFREKHAPPFTAKLYRPEKKTDYRVVPGPLKMVMTLQQWQAAQASKRDR